MPEMLAYRSTGRAAPGGRARSACGPTATRGLGGLPPWGRAAAGGDGGDGVREVTCFEVEMSSVPTCGKSLFKRGVNFHGSAASQLASQSLHLYLHS